MTAYETTSKPAEQTTAELATGQLATGEREPGRPAAAVIAGLRRSFGGRTVIDELDLTIPGGEFVALLGASGCGKSTLLRILAGLDTDIEGEVTVARHRAVAFQAPRLLPWKKVWRNVVLGVPKAGRAEAVAALAEVNLRERADAWPATLSGGEAQRASLARALIRHPDLLLLDEPFAALDALTRIRAQDLVGELWRRHSPAVLLVTHDVDEALRLADRVVVMKSGRIEHDVRIDLDRPREVGASGYPPLRAQLLQWLGVH
ncbi:MAG TPA: ABC transporter ATP-binding protein [Trebonia sp.]